MKRTKGITAWIIVGVFLCSLILNSNVVLAKAIANPTPVVSGLNSTYMFGDKITIKLTSTGTTNLVQYKVVLTNNKTGKSIDLLKGFTPKYYNPRQIYGLSFTPAEGGNYKLSVTSKLGGYKTKYSSTISKNFNVISDSDIIESISPVSKKVNVGEKYELPENIEAMMKDGSKKSVNVKWDSYEIKTDELGIKTYYGSVTGYDKRVMLTLNVVDEKIVSIDDINVSIDEGKEYKLPEVIKANVKNGKVDVKVTWDNDKVDTTKPGKNIYSGKVSGFDGKVNLVLTVNHVDLKVDKVLTSNLREISVTFNKKIKMSSVKNKNFRLYKGTVQVPVDAELLDDYKTVVLSLASQGIYLEKDKDYTLVVDGIKDDNQRMERSINDFKAQDNESPKIMDIYISGPKNLTIEFSEPIKNTSTGVINIKNNNKAIPYKSFEGYDTNKIEVILSYPMTRTAVYDISARGFKDFAGNVCDSKTVQLKYINDKKMIEAKLKYVDETCALIEFSKPVRGVSRYNFSNDVLEHYAIGVYRNKEMNNPVNTIDTVKRVWVKFYDREASIGYPFTDQSKKLIITGKNSYSEIKDIWDAEYKGESFEVKVVNDKEKPEVLSIEVQSESSILVKFDEDVSFSISNVELIESDGKMIKGFSISRESEDTYSINLGKSYAGRYLIIKIKNVEDMAVKPNKMDSYAKNIYIADKTPPRVEKVVKRFVSGLEQTIYIYFNEALNIQEVESFKLYIQDPVNNIMTSLTQRPLFHDRNSILKVEMTKDEMNKINAGYNLIVSNIKDTSKNVLEGQTILNSQITNYNSDDNKPKVVKIEAVDKNNVIVTFNQYLKRIDEAAFLVNGEFPQDVKISINKYGNTEVTLTPQNGKEFQSDLNGTATVSINTNKGWKVENDFNLCADTKTYTVSTVPPIVDKIPPAIKVVSGRYSVDAISNSYGIADTIIIEYEESIDTNKLSALSYSVEGRTVEKVYSNSSSRRGTPYSGRFVIIELKPVGSGVINGSGSLQITQLLDIYDMHDNKLSPSGEPLLTTDKTAPVVISRITSQIGKGETRILKFSEDIDGASKLTVENAIITASRGEGMLSFNWDVNGSLSITNLSSTESTDFLLGNRVTVTISDCYGNKSYNVIILGW